MSRWFCLLLPIAVLACGSKAIDLDGETGAIIASPDPTVLGTVRESVGQIAVDDARVYWLAVNQPNTPANAGEWTLYGCDKPQCASSLVTYSTRVSPNAGFGVRGGEIYWFEFGATSNGGVSAVQGTNRMNVMASSTTGAPAPRVIASDDWPTASFFDDDAIYYSVDNEIHALALPDGGSPETLATLTAQPALTLRAQGDYLYWVAAFAQSTGSIQRTRKDGTSAVETLADSLQIDALANPFGPAGGLALDASYFYWVENVLAGSIKRCPVAGCAGAPEALLSPVRSPTGLWLDGTNAYFLHEVDAYSYVISRCTIDQCAPNTPLAADVAGTNLFAVDDQYLYTVTTSQNLAPSDSLLSPVAQIRRFAK
jgi:hypothetical protein